MKRVAVLINPRSRGGNEPAIERDVVSALAGAKVAIVREQSADAALAALRREVSGGAAGVVAVGGDGTVNLALQAVSGTGVALAIVPRGTANDLASELGIPSSLAGACAAIRYGSRRPLDLLSVNGRVFATAGGLGLPSDVAESANAVRRLVESVRPARALVRSYGSGIYSVLLAGKLLQPGSLLRRVRVVWSGGRMSSRTALVLCNNQPGLGANFVVAPGTCNHDGRFRVTVFRDTARVCLARTLGSLRLGRVLAEPQIRSFESDQVRIESRDGRALTFMGDGEILARSLDLTISCLPEAAYVVAA